MKDSRKPGASTAWQTMIWIRGKAHRRERLAVRELLWFSDVNLAGSVRVLGPRTFVAMMMGPDAEWALQSASVLILKNFEQLAGRSAEQWLAALERFQRISITSGVQVVLVSEGPVNPVLLQIYRFCPLVFGALPRGRHPVDADHEVHQMLDRASRIAEVPIKRLSEKAANFLEETAVSSELNELLDLVVEGIRRSDGHTLRFRDLLPNFAKYFDPEDPSETYCN